MTRLKEMGFPVEMDDFGSGYSSLNMLSQMNLDILKLDMGFIQNEMKKAAEQSILSDIISMAHRLNLKVVAEGIETEEQAERLREVTEALWDAQTFYEKMGALMFGQAFVYGSREGA